MPYNNIIDRSGAEALMPEEASREIFQHMPEASFVMRLGRMLPRMSRAQRRLPVLSALPIAYFVGEAPSNPASDAYKQTTEVEWANKYLNAEEIAAIVPIPESVLDDADYDIWAEIRPLINEALGRVFDAAVVYGTNAPADWPTDLLASATAAANVIELGSLGGDLFDDIMALDGLLSKIEQKGYLVTGHVASLAMKGRLRGLRDDQGNPIFKSTFREGVQGASSYELDGAEVAFPLNGVINDAVSHLVSGQWDKLVWSMRTDITTKLLTEAVITDPSDSNTIIYNLAQQDMVALRVTMRIAWQVPNPINRIEENDSVRYPFGFLVPNLSS